MNAKANSRCATFVLNLIMVIELLIGHSVEAAATLCSQEDAIKAETKASTLRSWHAVFNSYQNSINAMMAQSVRGTVIQSRFYWRMIGAE
jgi:hypothetical protein